jgi:hypothetical protein
MLRLVTHLLNLLAASLLFYASVTRGGVAVARVLERLARARS